MKSRCKATPDARAPVCGIAYTATKWYWTHLLSVKPLNPVVKAMLTAYAGIPLFVRAVRSLGVPASVKRHLELKQRQRGFDEATYVESFLVLNALGGECIEDFERLREDQGLAGDITHLPHRQLPLRLLDPFLVMKGVQELPRRFRTRQLVAQHSGARRSCWSGIGRRRVPSRRCTTC